MCILSVKLNKNLLPLCTKSYIVALGYYKDQVWSKRDWYAPGLWSNPLWFLVKMVVSKYCPLCQDGCKNAFGQGVPPEDKITILSCLHLAIPKHNQMSIGFSSALSTVFVGVRVTGMTN